ncbi:DNA topoisomerase-1 [Metamycoplasma subdolum]|uniref:DNA topoisomerase 1 n=1 Tax=Metamycoplasma subdolum TaxID=92407 RepID=A0A3M0A3Y5_9BACT|nr:type I DNA topoisomerase [Metamycoplasma subdolum]RMA77458.1 DNA topoisomerase-1 [Metamycoplasma subdolum]
MAYTKVMIVESPNKVATIQKYVGKDVQVLSSVGHILKLSTSGEKGLGIDLQNWEPRMIVDKSKSKTIKELREATRKASEVLIATDPDREGEAIAQNLVDTLKVNDKYKRIKYNEITEEAIKNALENPIMIDIDLVKAQKARRMLDRIIGFELSQLMKKKVKNAPTNPSAGRVQSIALKLVCDKEKEIEAFIPILYSKIEAKIAEDVNATFYYLNHKDFADDATWIKPEKSKQILDELNKDKRLKVSNFEITQRKDKQITPFKQSVLYKEAKYSSTVVQVTAQKLFERGLISYPRTDSTRLNDSFIAKVRKFIEENYGQNYIANDIKSFSGAQDAHEAIRPTDIYLNPSLAKSKFRLNEEENYIYELIYNKTLSAIMQVPIREIYHYDLISSSGHNFRMSYSRIIFDGYYKLTKNYEASKVLPNYKNGDILDVQEFEKLDKETQPPARYNEGSLIKMLDDIKVGRPSTFASTVKVIKSRLFVENKNGALHPTEFGKTVMSKLIDGFPTIMNEEYTASVENDLDLIAEGKEDYKSLMSEFYSRFNVTLDEATKTIEIAIMPEETIDESCPDCGNKLMYRYTKATREKFIGCTNFPACRYTRDVAGKKRKFWRFKRSTK